MLESQDQPTSFTLILETGSRRFHESVIVRSVLVWMRKQSCGENGPAWTSWSPPLSWMGSQILHGSAASRSQVPNHNITLPPHTFKVKARPPRRQCIKHTQVCGTMNERSRKPKESWQHSGPRTWEPRSRTLLGFSGKHSSVAAADVIICQGGWSNFWTHFQLGVTFRND